MKRVLVIGSGGSGKSTFARRLGELLDIEVKHLDKFYWRAGWQEPSKEEWLKTVNALVREESWIMDGNFSGTLEVRIQHCDTIVFLDLPRLLCLGRIARRRLLNHKRSRPDMAEGCPEKLDWSFIQWVWTYPYRSRPKVVRLLHENSGIKQIVWLRSTAEVRRFLEWTRMNRKQD
ncbi:MAG TPA: DNA topology modulation protein [Pyrinomonadaceae bacterium]